MKKPDKLKFYSNHKKLGTYNLEDGVVFKGHNIILNKAREVMSINYWQEFSQYHLIDQFKNSLCT